MNTLEEYWGYIVVFTAMALTAIVVFAITGCKKNEISNPSEKMFSARHQFTWWTLGLSYFATNTGAWILYTPAEVASWVSWWGLIGYALSSAIPFWVLCWLGPAVARQMCVTGMTFTDYLEWRFGRATQIIVLIISLFSTWLALSADFTAIGSTLTLLIPELHPAASIVPVGIITLVYSIYGGLTASIITDRIQGIGLLGLTIACVVAAATKVEFKSVDWSESATFTQDGLLVFWILIVSIFPAGIINSPIWQKIWAAKTEKDNIWGLVFGSVLIIISTALFCVTGVIAKGAFPDEFPENASYAFFLILQTLGTVWLVLTAYLTVFCVSSSIDTYINGMTALIGRDVVRRGANLNWARLFGVVLTIPAMILGIFGFSIFQLFTISNLLVSIINAPLMLGLWRRMTSIGCIVGCCTAFFSIFCTGWIYTHDFVDGLSWILLPQGPYVMSTLVTYLVVNSCSFFFTIVVSLLDVHLNPDKIFTKEPEVPISASLGSSPSHTHTHTSTHTGSHTHTHTHTQSLKSLSIISSLSAHTHNTKDMGDEECMHEEQKVDDT